MKENIRRLVLFAAIVGLGSVMIFVDIPLIYMLPLIVVVGIVLLILVGAITVAEIKAGLGKLSFGNLRQRLSLKRKGKSDDSAKKPAAQKESKEKKISPPQTPKIKEKTGGFKAHLSLLASSISSLKKVLSEKKRPAKKPDEINKLLDRTISEKVNKSSVSGSTTTVTGPAGGGGAGGSLPSINGDESDPFKSLSDEDFDAGLLDGLDDTELGTAASAALPDSAAGGGADVSDDLSMPDLDTPDVQDADANAEAEAILKAHGESGLDAAEGSENGGALGDSIGDLDNINLDEIDLGDDTPQADSAPQPAAETASPPPTAPAAAPASSDLIPATPMLPPTAGDGLVEEQTDMSSFAAGSAPGTDEDMLSSLAADIKQVKKEKDVSLLRDLKDFKAPATDIEKELQSMADQINSVDRQGSKSKMAQGEK